MLRRILAIPRRRGMTTAAYLNIHDINALHIILAEKDRCMQEKDKRLEEKDKYLTSQLEEKEKRLLEKDLLIGRIEKELEMELIRSAHFQGMLSLRYLIGKNRN